MNVQMYSVNMTPIDYGRTPAMEWIREDQEPGNAILTNFYTIPQDSGEQIPIRGLKLFEVMNLDEYSPGVLFNALV